MSENNWRRGGAFGQLKKRVLHIQGLFEKALAIKQDEMEEKIKQVHDVQQQAILANQFREMKYEDLKGQVISDDLD